MLLAALLITSEAATPLMWEFAYNPEDIFAKLPDIIRCGESKSSDAAEEGQRRARDAHGPDVEAPLARRKVR